MERVFVLALACALWACATPRPKPYAESCRDPANPCAFSYDFEPSGAALDPFAPEDKGPRFIVANEDALLFHWVLSPQKKWDHAAVSFARSLAHVMTKVESVASARCEDVPVLLVASNFMPGRFGRSPQRERIVAIVGDLDDEPRILEATGAAIAGLGEGAKVEGLALSADCRTLYVGLRSVGLYGHETLRREIHPIELDIDWQGTRENVRVGEAISLPDTGSCSGSEEGLSSIDLLSDGSMLLLTSFEETLVEQKEPTDIPEGRLGGTLWKRSADGSVSRLACFPGHKPEAVVAMPDGASARVILEDDEYGGRPIRAFAVGVGLGD